MGLVERDPQLAMLADQFALAATSGRLVLVSGEPGVGKSALLEHFRRDHLAGRRVLAGRCDDLFAPRPFGPILEFVRMCGPVLAGALATGDPGEVADALLGELTDGRAPVILLIEDLHWADEATLDLVRVIGRRLDSLRALILITHRTGLDVDHPLQRVLGGLTSPSVVRMRVPSLSAVGVQQLASGRSVDATELHERTGGNPFFVVELLTHGDGCVPETVRDSVLSRAAALSAGGRAALYAAAILGSALDPLSVQQVAECDAGAIDECVTAGLLVYADRLAFRHDLTREAIEQSIAPLRRRELHRRAFAAPALGDDVVRRANHAIAAGDRDGIVEVAEAAGDHCAARGAYREAAALYGAALEHTDGSDPAARKRRLKARARTCERVGQLDQAIEAATELIAAERDPRARGAWEGWLGGVYRFAGRGEDAWRVLRSAVERLEPFGPSQELAQALATLAQQQELSGEHDAAIANAGRAEEIAETVGAEDIVVHALDTRSVAMAMLGNDDAEVLLRHAVARAERGGLVREVVRANLNLAIALLGWHRPSAALTAVDRGLPVAVAQDFVVLVDALLIVRAQAHLDLAEWDATIVALMSVLGRDDLPPISRVTALLHLGRVRMRRGDPEATEVLDEALAATRGFAEPQHTIPLHFARAEAAWLADKPARAIAEIEAAGQLAAEHPDPRYVGPHAFWARRLGMPYPAPATLAGPYALAAAGDIRAAADAWDAAGYRYDAADVLADSDDVAQLRDALARLNQLGARPRAQQVERRLRRLGVRDLPRGPRTTTQANPARLTARELEVAALLAEGLSNNEIAESLVVSPKTVDHHVTAVLTKLQVSNRGRVASAATRLGITFDPAGAAR